jgi:hypothetical protein
MEDPTKRNDLAETNDRIINLGTAMATTARKFMDGNHSAVLYNAIMLVDGEQWVQFLTRVIDGLDRGLSLRLACTDAVRYGVPSMNLIGIAFKMMNDMIGWNDETDGPGWASLESGIKYCHGWPIKEVISEQA